MITLHASGKVVSGGIRYVSKCGGGGGVHSFSEIRGSSVSKIIWYFLDKEIHFDLKNQVGRPKSPFLDPPMPVT